MRLDTELPLAGDPEIGIEKVHPKEILSSEEHSQGVLTSPALMY